ncbi:putative vitellogenin receptor [Nephila pilipes]|uniref:Putative vitellogenin receptor n=1 Tax=Nephila pilipes TaxID=299642 RepID=A0A8X6TAY0_NEPPI|nr:putative vitellogenin receptor [Nephila pilipes]
MRKLNTAFLAQAASECTAKEYFCMYQLRCIPNDWLCDGKDDCGDAADEGPEYCEAGEYNETTPMYYIDTKIPQEQYCGIGNFRCDNGLCIDLALTCDSKIDCEDGSDEMYCIHTEESITYKDVNECDIPGKCSQFCNNTEGGIICSCAEGYNLEKNERECKASDKQVSLILMWPDQICELDLNTESLNTITVDSGSGMRGMDYDLFQKVIYWTEEKEKTIYSYSIEMMEKNVLLTTPTKPFLLRRDWITKNIYYTDDDGNIVCCSGNGKQCSTVIQSEIHIQGFDISPHASLMFWSAWKDGTNGYLERAEMDGTNLTVIVAKEIFWPSALTVDQIQEMIYWSDIKLGAVMCADFNGLKRRTVIARHMVAPLSMTMFEDYVYWSDRKTDRLIRCYKFGGKNCTTVHQKIAKVEAMIIVHSTMQFQGTNRCANSNCSHICLPNRANFTCTCDDRGLSNLSKCEISVATKLHESDTQGKCPENYCFQNAPCVVDNGLYICDCPAFFKGEKCEMDIASKSKHSTMYYVAVSLFTLVFICLVVGLLIFYLEKRYKSRHGYENPATVFIHRHHKCDRIENSQIKVTSSGDSNEQFQEMKIM